MPPTESSSGPSSGAGNLTRSARPNSLVAPVDARTAKPEREPVAFAINLVGAPPDVEELVNNIRVVAEQFLYHWKTFPISE